VFANRYTAFVDACVLVGALKRNILLTLAEAEFFRVRWSKEVLDEVERGIERFLGEAGDADPSANAKKQRKRVESAFQEASVDNYERFACSCEGLPDEDDIHVVAAALKIRASTIVTDNLSDFPPAILAPLNMEVRSADDFIADTIDLDPGKAVAAIRRMRERFNKPQLTAEQLLLTMEARGLTKTADVLRPYVESL
jgi:hypothetical protein